MKKFDEDYQLLATMYRNGYFPDFLVDKVINIDLDVEDAIGERDW